MKFVSRKCFSTKVDLSMALGSASTKVELSVGLGNVFKKISVNCFQLRIVLCNLSCFLLRLVMNKCPQSGV